MAAKNSTELKLLERQDINRICSGQSVVDLATAVKELLENAIDANATQIEIKLKEYGKESIEVSDNGDGIASKNFDTIALKHYTSKIIEFEDIETVSSFGFRGEALSALCQLSNKFHVFTRTKENNIGTLIEYERTGKVRKQIKKARSVGTTVILEDLFKPLPVRYKEFHRSIKKHYARLLRILQGYAVICSGVKICCYNITGKNSSRQIVLSTQADQNVGSNIANVFGIKFFKSLLPIDFVLEDADNNQDSPDIPRKRVVGYISKVGIGVGRSDNDRQFFYINGRPFDLHQVKKVVNDVWRQYEMKQKPACVLDFRLPLEEYDVNVTPDKRETFIKDETGILESLKRRLIDLYEPSRGTFSVQPLLTSFSVKESAIERNTDELSTDTEQVKKKAKLNDSSFVQTENSSKGPDDKRKSSSYNVIFENPDIPLESKSKYQSTSEQTIAKSLRDYDVTEPSTTIVDWNWDYLLEERKRVQKGRMDNTRRVKRMRCPSTCTVGLSNEIVPNEAATAALQRVLKKDDFVNMKVVGQFNLGFIIGKLDDDLFIIDQHASDEKYNYETLQKTTVLHQQPLVCPLPLEVTAGEEMVIMDNLDVFQRNGISFQVSQDAPATKKLKIVALPFSKHTQFGPEDVRELASMLMDSPTSTADMRLPKITSMFASRACRSSIMIGTALRKDDMKKIVRNLASLDQPWNCPHGRPTLRHLVDLSHLATYQDQLS